MLTALLTFQDTNEAYHAPTPTPPVVAASTKPVTPAPEANVPHTSSNIPPQNNGPPPVIPPKPAPKTGVERVAELHMIRSLPGEGEANEVEIGLEGNVNDYAKYAESLLKVSSLCWGGVQNMCLDTQCNAMRNVRMRLCFLSRFGQRLLRKYPKFFKWLNRLNVYGINPV